MKKGIVWASAVALSMSISQASLAATDTPPPPAPENKEHMIKKLDLTPAQQAKINIIRTEARKAAQPKMREIHEITMKLNELSRAEKLDMPKINELINTKKELIGELMKIKVMLEHDISLVLTPEQKEKIETLKPGLKAPHEDMGD